jgi:hypothetical protein
VCRLRSRKRPKKRINRSKEGHGHGYGLEQFRLNGGTRCDETTGPTLRLNSLLLLAALLCSMPMPCDPCISSYAFPREPLPGPPACCGGKQGWLGGPGRTLSFPCLRLSPRSAALSSVSVPLVHCCANCRRGCPRRAQPFRVLSSSGGREPVNPPPENTPRARTHSRPRGPQRRKWTITTKWLQFPHDSVPSAGFAASRSSTSGPCYLGRPLR